MYIIYTLKCPLAPSLSLSFIFALTSVMNPLMICHYDCWLFTFYWFILLFNPIFLYWIAVNSFECYFNKRNAGYTFHKMEGWFQDGNRNEDNVCHFSLPSEESQISPQIVPEGVQVYSMDSSSGRETEEKGTKQLTPPHRRRQFRYFQEPPLMYKKSPRSTRHPPQPWDTTLPLHLEPDPFIPDQSSIWGLSPTDPPQASKNTKPPQPYWHFWHQSQAQHL